MQTYEKLYINGQRVCASTSQTIDVINPFTESVCGRVPDGSKEDADAAVKAAKDAFESWSQTSPEYRAQILERLTEKLNEKKDLIAETVSLELGIPIGMSKNIQSALPAASAASYVALARDFRAEEHIENSLVVKEPAGVCAFVTPWNYPLHQIMGKVAPALAAGCTMVVKPSSETPLNAFVFAQVVDEIGMPPGVFNLVSGSGKTVGEALCSHEMVDLISFTGSTRAGKRIGELAARTIKRLTLELGGKSTNIIMGDAEIEKAVGNGVKNMFMNSGQTCSALSRMLVPEERHDEMVEMAVKAARQITMGDPSDPANFMGPLVSERQQKKVLGYIRTGIDEGATLSLGSPEPPFEQGFFVSPTIFSNVSNDMTIAREEIFGPVLCIIPFKDEDDAVRIANDSIYGLSGAVWSGDKERALSIARRLRTGQVFINGGRYNILAPFGGYKQSGRGREFGKFGLEEFLEIKAILL